REFADRGENVAAGRFPTLHPRAAAQAHADIGAVRDLERLHVAVKCAEDMTRDAAEFRNRRVIGMDADSGTLLFGGRNHLLDEVGVVFPQLLLREAAAMRQRSFEYLVGPVSLRGLLTERARRCSATRSFPLRAPDTVAHVSVGRVVDARFAEVTQKLL